MVSSINAEARSDKVGFSMALEVDGDWHEDMASMAAMAKNQKRKVKPAFMVQRDGFWGKKTARPM